MSHILVTGATGFIGSHLVRKLIEVNERERWADEILCLVRPTSDLSPLQGLPVKLIIGDLRMPETLAQAAKGAVFVFHLAAELYATQRKQFWETNVEGTKNLLAAVRQHAGGSLRRFVHVSSQAAAGPSSSATPTTEDIPPTEPVSWYAETKLKAEELVKDQEKQGLPVTIVRPCSVYGERDISFVSLFPIVKMRIQPLNGFRKRYTGMVYAPDLVEGIIAAAREPKAAGQVYFLANPENYSTRQMVKAMASAVGRPVGLVVPMPIFLLKAAAIFTELFSLFSRKKPVPSRDKVRDLSQVYWLCSPKKAERDLGWRAKTSLLDGMKSSYRYCENKKREIRNMAGDGGITLWLKYFVSFILLGGVIEALAAFGDVYKFNSIGITLAVIFGFWGLVFGSISMAVRRCGFLIQYLPGFVLLFSAELLNHFVIQQWKFLDGTSLVGMRPVTRALVLGIVTGFIPPLMNGIMRGLTKRKLRLG